MAYAGSRVAAATVRSPSRLWLARAGLIGCLLMAAIIVSSAYLRLTTMGVGCKPWPACYGRIYSEANAGPPPAAASTGVTVARLLHRAAAMLVAVLSVLTVLLSLARDVRSRANVALALIAITLTVTLAVVGRMSATLLVPAVGIVNLLGGFAMLACFWMLRLNNAVSPAGSGPTPEAVRRLAIAALVVFVMQAAAGALISVTYSAGLCSSTWDCEPGPPTVADQPAREPHLFAPQSIDANGKVIAAASAATMQTLHRLAGIGAAVLFAIVGIWLVSRAGRRTLGSFVLGLAILEAGLGIVMSEREFPLLAAMGHNAVAALLLLLLVTLAWKRGQPRTSD